jgi:hypothetical protein
MCMFSKNGGRSMLPSAHADLTQDYRLLKKMLEYKATCQSIQKA